MLGLHYQCNVISKVFFFGFFWRDILEQAEVQTQYIFQQGNEKKVEPSPLLMATSGFWSWLHPPFVNFFYFCPSKTNLGIFFLFWNIRNVQFLWIHCIKNLQYNMFDFSINNFTIWNQSFLLYLVLFILMCCDFSAACCRSCCGISNTAILLLTSNWQKLFS